MNTRLSRLTGTTTLLLALAAAGCGGEDVEETGAPDTLATTPADTSTAATGAEEVAVTLRDYSIEMPSTVPAGPTTFRVANDGGMLHNFEVEGQGIEEEFEEDLQPGAERTLEVDLEPGTYTVYCPIADHRSRGMETELTVTGNGAGM